MLTLISFSSFLKTSLKRSGDPIKRFAAFTKIRHHQLVHWQCKNVNSFADPAPQSNYTGFEDVSMRAIVLTRVALEYSGRTTLPSNRGA